MTPRIIVPRDLPSFAKAGLSRQTGWGKLKYPSGRLSTLEYDHEYYCQLFRTFQSMEQKKNSRKDCKTNSSSDTYSADSVSYFPDVSSLMRCHQSLFSSLMAGCCEMYTYQIDSKPQTIVSSPGRQNSGPVSPHSGSLFSTSWARTGALGALRSLFRICQASRLSGRVSPRFSMTDRQPLR